MTAATDSQRVVPYSPRIVQTFKEAIVAFRADPDGKWIKREDHESLLAEAESRIALKEMAVTTVQAQRDAYRKERDALQAQVDAVRLLADEVQDCLSSVEIPAWHRLHSIPLEIRAAIGEA